jgi:membrane-bound ClpP family serine protease
MTVEAATILGVCVLLIAGMIVTASRHKKSGNRNVRLIGSAAVVDTKLAPQGTVLIQGELWPACATDGKRLPPGCKVKVVRTHDHLLIVELQD